MAGLRESLMALRFTGMLGALRIARYTKMRSWLDLSYQLEHAEEETYDVLTPGEVVGTQALPHGARFTFENAALEIVFLAPNLARLSWEPGQPPLPYALAKTEWSGAVLQMRQLDEATLLTSPQLGIKIGPDGGLEFLSPHGEVLRASQPPLVQCNPHDPSWSDSAELRPQECLYGLGEQAGPFDLRGERRRLWNADPAGSYGPGYDPIYMPMPVVMGLHHAGSYLIFYENYRPGWFITDPHPQTANGSPGRMTMSFDGGMLRYYFIPGTPAQMLERFTELTGRPGLPPLWSLGYHQSRWGYMTSDQIRQVAQAFRKHDIPLSAIHLDIDYMHGYRVFTVDPGRFPDLKALSAELDAQGVRLVAIIDPAVKKDLAYPVYRQGLEQDAFCKLASKPFYGVVWPGWSAFPDFTRPATRSWWAGLYPRLLDQGIAGIWHDMNEPTSFTSDGGHYLPLGLQHDMDGRRGDHTHGHNVYALLMNRAGHEGLRRARPDRRPWIISRSGWVSQSRYAWSWTGDTESTWTALRMTLPTILGSGLSGQPYNGPDIGGFSGNPTPELYLRWLQLAAFLPFFRTHSAFSADRREPWAYGEPWTTLIRQAIQLRYRLLPYLYTLAWEASQTGFPLVRPLFWAEPHNQALWPIADAFLLGDALLVAPILKSEDQTDPNGMRALIREVQLPAAEWRGFWDDGVYRGPHLARVNTDLNSIPFFVRSGSVLPLAQGKGLILHLYSPPASSPEATHGRLYTDVGEGYGDARLDHFTMRRETQALELSWAHEGEYPWPYFQVELQLHGFSARRAWLDDRLFEVQDQRLALGAQTPRTIRFEQA